MSVFWEMLSYPFLVRAFVVGILVSLCASLLGSCLVLKRYAMIGDGLSHVGFAALAIAYPLGIAPLSLAIPVCVLTAFVLLQVKENAAIKGDAVLAMVCSGSLAVGVMVVSLTRGMNTELDTYLFGSILAMKRSDMWISLALALSVLLLYVLFYHRIFAVTFDEQFARAVGVDVKRYEMVLAVLAAVTVVLGMRMMGSLLISCLIVFPALSAMRVTRRFRTTVLLAGGIGVAGFLIGLVFSYLHAVPTGACIVVTDILLFFLFWGMGACRGKLPSGHQQLPAFPLHQLAHPVRELVAGNRLAVAEPFEVDGDHPAGDIPGPDGEGDRVKLGLGKEPVFEEVDHGKAEVQAELLGGGLGEKHLGKKDSRLQTLEQLFEEEGDVQWLCRLVEDFLDIGEDLALDFLGNIGDRLVMVVEGLPVDTGRLAEFGHRDFVEFLPGKESHASSLQRFSCADYSTVFHVAFLLVSVVTSIA